MASKMNLVRLAWIEPWNELRLEEQRVRAGAGKLQPERQIV